MRSGYSTTTPRRKNTTLSSVNRCHWPQHQHHAAHSWFEDHLVRPKRSCLYELLKPGDSITGDRYRLQLIRFSREKRSEYEQIYDKVILLHDNARPHVAKILKKYLETLKCFTAPIFSRQLLLLITGCPKDAARFGKSPIYFFRRNRKLAPKLDHLQRRVIFSRWNSKIAWEMGKSSRQRWTIL